MPDNHFFNQKLAERELLNTYNSALNQPVLPGGIIEVDGPNTVVAATRTFDTGATRDTDEGKLDFEGFLSPLVLRAFAEYMNEKRKMPDGSLRDSDNWQRGIPLDAYMKSMWRHFFAVWESYRDPETTSLDAVEEMLALFFNVQGMLHEVLKRKK